ncbi:MAG TPA: lytic transglycosylase domain-containing protein, partial [Gemmatimonadales bacterium]|nr:lytic transglycosylase domain-containing protein [Gemmatimonadales bacterium]
MPRFAIAAALVLAACSTGNIDTSPSPLPAPQQSANRWNRPAAGDTMAEAMLLDSLESISPDSEMPALTLEEVAGPSWDINVEGFAGHPRVQYYIDFFTGRGRNGFQSWLDRMPRYESYARERFAEQGLPGDLVYLALIESGFSPVAVSRVRAVGMWQFMQATGRGYGLRVDAWVDERRDPIKSTDAAARHLKDLTDRFGSHFLAAAAYNGGAGRVGRGLTRITALAGSGDEQVDPSSDEMFFELAQTPHLFQETKDYVPKLIAAALIAKDPERYDFVMPDSVEPFPLDSVMVDGSTGLDLIAKLAKVKVEEIGALNPHILRGYTPPGGRYPVRVPSGTASAISAAYAAIPASERV